MLSQPETGEIRTALRSIPLTCLLHPFLQFIPSPPNQGAARYQNGAIPTTARKYYLPTEHSRLTSTNRLFFGVRGPLRFRTFIHMSIYISCTQTLKAHLTFLTPTFSASPFVSSPGPDTKPYHTDMPINPPSATLPERCHSTPPQQTQCQFSVDSRPACRATGTRTGETGPSSSRTTDLQCSASLKRQFRHRPSISPLPLTHNTPLFLGALNPPTAVKKIKIKKGSRPQDSYRSVFEPLCRHRRRSLSPSRLSRRGIDTYQIVP